MALETLKTGSVDLRRVVNAVAAAVDTAVGSNGVTGTQLSSGAQRLLAFTGKNGAGACTATGTKVGDKVTGIVNLTDGTTATSLFEATITVADQIQQSSATDLSAKKFSLLVVAKS
jgi:hypothetical protein